MVDVTGAEPTRYTAPTLADVAKAEQERVTAGAAACGKTCDDGCHGNLTCVRVEHPHDPDADMGPDAPRGNVVVHLGYQPDGTLTQWTCLPGDHDGLSDEQRAATRATTEAAARTEATHALVAAVDPVLLLQLLRDGAHLP